MRGLIATIGLSLLVACELNVDVKIDDEEEVDTDTLIEENCQSHIEVEGVESTWNLNVAAGQENVQFVRMTIQVHGDTIMYHPRAGFEGPLVLQETPLVSNINLVDSSGGSWNQVPGELDMSGSSGHQRVQLDSFLLPDGNHLLDLVATISEDAWNDDQVHGSMILSQGGTDFTSPFGCDVLGIDELQIIRGPTLTIFR